MEKRTEERIPQKDEIYRHFKGGFYKIVTLAKDCDSAEAVVVYQALYGEGEIYVRPLASFMEVLDREQYPKAEQVHRFEQAPEDTPILDPLLEAFLEADTHRERLNALRGLEHRITHEMINTMAVVLDLDIPEGSLEQRYRDVENSILTRERFEGTRLV